MNRQRLNLSTSTLPFETYNPSRVIVKSARVETIIQEHLDPMDRHVHFMKIDVDQTWKAIFDGLRPLLRRKQISIVTLEIDPAVYSSMNALLDDIQQTVDELARNLGYDTFLKVACDQAGIGDPKTRDDLFVRAGFLQLSSGTLSRMDQIPGVFAGLTGCPSHISPWNGKPWRRTHAFPQDVVFVDKGQPALYDALAAGNEECDFDYPVARPQRP